MVSVVIAAHNEAAVVGRCLDALRAQQGAGDLEVVVVANGCSDATVAAATRPGVKVLDLSEPGKSAALVAGDAVAHGFPRVYLDADIVLPPHALAAALEVLADPSVLACAPLRHVVTTRSSLLVRAYMAVSSRLPAYRNSLFGRGMVVLSKTGRRRFDTFPGVVADDLFLDSLFSADEKRPIPSVDVGVVAPATARSLLRRLVRVRRGNADLRATAPGSVPSRGTVAEGPTVRRSDKLSWLTDVVLQRPVLAPAGAVYASFTLLAAVLARVGSRRPPSWGQDQTSRGPVPAGRAPEATR
ncbi:glycosyltransferase family 2 protein [Microlunatus flavus]|uniref:4,4'-diaponeurosporenoate glycosyltransferase n=1 Tax=Microlunatus flavus TaxID=1036181 RepID=A0A1H9DG19_9ACTN|nr:glycosyltransferase [Microlunatus flavus]SEQ12452.1 Glycosyltransferase involved in cell wall bisynthesis [Microlunatus flavus]